MDDTLYYILEIDYEWREVSTKTTTETYTTEEKANARIEQAKKEGKYEGYRLYKLRKELVKSE